MFLVCVMMNLFSLSILVLFWKAPALCVPGISIFPNGIFWMNCLERRDNYTIHSDGCGCLLPSLKKCLPVCLHPSWLDTQTGRPYDFGIVERRRPEVETYGTGLGIYVIALSPRERKVVIYFYVRTIPAALSVGDRLRQHFSALESLKMYCLSGKADRYYQSVDLFRLKPVKLTGLRGSPLNNLTLSGWMHSELL